MSLPENLNKYRKFPVIILVGPTAVGKTEVSIQLAKEIDAEIVSADSRQIYKYMDIGTAKPPLPERQGIVHHLLDYINPGENFSSGAYADIAHKIIDKIRASARNIIVVGGSGLYIRALLYGMIAFDQKDADLRQALKEQLRQHGLAYLYRELQSVDPELSEKLSENDTQRILRGLEVYRMSGEKLSSLQKEKEIAASFPYVQVGLTMDRAKLYERINNRVEQMLQLGLIDEVRGLISKGFADTNALNAVGYKEVVQYLSKEIPYQQMVELIQRNSRRYAKRQFTWFRKDDTIHWFEMPDDNIIEKIIAKIKSLSAK